VWSLLVEWSLESFCCSIEERIKRRKTDTMRRSSRRKKGEPTLPAASSTEAKDPDDPEEEKGEKEEKAEDEGATEDPTSEPDTKTKVDEQAATPTIQNKAPATSATALAATRRSTRTRRPTPRSVLSTSQMALVARGGGKRRRRSSNDSSSTTATKETKGTAKGDAEEEEEEGHMGTGGSGDERDSEERPSQVPLQLINNNNIASSGGSESQRRPKARAAASSKRRKQGKRIGGDGDDDDAEDMNDTNHSTKSGDEIQESDEKEIPSQKKKQKKASSSLSPRRQSRRQPSHASHSSSNNDSKAQKSENLTEEDSSDDDGSKASDSVVPIASPALEEEEEEKEEEEDVQNDNDDVGNSDAEAKGKGSQKDESENEEPDTDEADESVEDIPTKKKVFHQRGRQIEIQSMKSTRKSKKKQSAPPKGKPYAPAEEEKAEDGDSTYNKVASRTPPKKRSATLQRGDKFSKDALDSDAEQESTGNDSSKPLQRRLQRKQPAQSSKKKKPSGEQDEEVEDENATSPTEEAPKARQPDIGDSGDDDSTKTPKKRSASSKRRRKVSKDAPDFDADVDSKEKEASQPLETRVRQRRPAKSSKTTEKSHPTEKHTISKEDEEEKEASDEDTTSKVEDDPKKLSTYQSDDDESDEVEGARPTKQRTDAEEEITRKELAPPLRHQAPRKGPVPSRESTALGTLKEKDEIPDEDEEEEEYAEEKVFSSHVEEDPKTLSSGQSDNDGSIVHAKVKTSTRGKKGTIRTNPPPSTRRQSLRQASQAGNSGTHTRQPKKSSDVKPDEDDTTPITEEANSGSTHDHASAADSDEDNAEQLGAVEPGDREESKDEPEDEENEPLAPQEDKRGHRKPHSAAASSRGRRRPSKPSDVSTSDKDAAKDGNAEEPENGKDDASASSQAEASIRPGKSAMDVEEKEEPPTDSEESQGELNSIDEQLVGVKGKTGRKKIPTAPAGKLRGSRPSQFINVVGCHENGGKLEKESDADSYNENGDTVASSQKHTGNSTSKTAMGIDDESKQNDKANARNKRVLNQAMVPSTRQRRRRTIKTNRFSRSDNHDDGPTQDTGRSDDNKVEAKSDSLVPPRGATGRSAFNDEDELHPDIVESPTDEGEPSEQDDNGNEPGPGIKGGSGMKEDKDEEQSITPVATRRSLRKRPPQRLEVNRQGQNIEIPEVEGDKDPNAAEADEKKKTSADDDTESILGSDVNAVKRKGQPIPSDVSARRSRRRWPTQERNVDPNTSASDEDGKPGDLEEDEGTGKPQLQEDSDDESDGDDQRVKASKSKSMKQDTTNHAEVVNFFERGVVTDAGHEKGELELEAKGDKEREISLAVSYRGRLRQPSRASNIVTDGKADDKKDKESGSGKSAGGPDDDGVSSAPETFASIEDLELYDGNNQNGSEQKDVEGTKVDSDLEDIHGSDVNDQDVCTSRTEEENPDIAGKLEPSDEKIDKGEKNSEVGGDPAANDEEEKHESPRQSLRNWPYQESGNSVLSADVDKRAKEIDHEQPGTNAMQEELEIHPQTSAIAGQDKIRNEADEDDIAQRENKEGPTVKPDASHSSLPTEPERKPQQVVDDTLKSVEESEGVKIHPIDEETDQENKFKVSNKDRKEGGHNKSVRTANSDEVKYISQRRESDFAPPKPDEVEFNSSNETKPSETDRITKALPVAIAGDAVVTVDLQRNRLTEDIANDAAHDVFAEDSYEDDGREAQTEGGRAYLGSTNDDQAVEAVGDKYTGDRDARVDGDDDAGEGVGDRVCRVGHAGGDSSGVTGLEEGLDGVEARNQPTDLDGDQADDKSPEAESAGVENGAIDGCRDETSDHTDERDQRTTDSGSVEMDSSAHRIDQVKMDDTLMENVGDHSLDQLTLGSHSTPESQTVSKDEAHVATDDAYVSNSKEDDLFSRPALEGVTAAEKLGTESSLASEYEGTSKLQENEEIGVQLDDPKAIGGDTGSSSPNASTGIPDVDNPEGGSNIDLSAKEPTVDGKHTEESEPIADDEQAEESDLRTTRESGGLASESDRHTDQTLGPSDRNVHEPIANRSDPDHSDDDFDQFHDARMELPPSEPPSPVRIGLETSRGWKKSSTISSPSDVGAEPLHSPVGQLANANDTKTSRPPGIAEEASEKDNDEPTILDIEGQGDGKLNPAKKETVESLKAGEGASDETVGDEDKTTDSLDVGLSEQKVSWLKETILDLTLQAKGISDASEHDDAVKESERKREVKDVTTEMLEQVSGKTQHDSRSNAQVLEPSLEQKNSADGMSGSVDAKEGAMDRKADVQDGSNGEMLRVSSNTAKEEQKMEHTQSEMTVHAEETSLNKQVDPTGRQALDKLPPAHVGSLQNNEESAAEDERTSRVGKSSSGEIIAATSATGWDESDEVDDAKVKFDEEKEGILKTDIERSQKRARVENADDLSPFAFDEDPLNKRYRLDVGATSIDEGDDVDGASEVAEVAEPYVLFDKYDEHKIDRAKSMLYSAGSAVHRGRGFERKFAEYWEAMTLRISDTLSNHTTERCRIAFKAFLKTKKLRRLHNKYVLGEIIASSLVSFPLHCSLSVLTFL
jgi:hypothetical protein